MFTAIMAADKIQKDSDTFSDIPGSFVTVPSGGDYIAQFHGKFLVPRSGSFELRFTVNGSDVFMSTIAIDVSAGGLMNDRQYSLHRVLSLNVSDVVACQWRAVSGKITLSDRSLVIIA